MFVFKTSHLVAADGGLSCKYTRELGDNFVHFLLLMLIFLLRPFYNSNFRSIKPYFLFFF
jgi:hypothetical protein